MYYFLCKLHEANLYNLFNGDLYVKMCIYIKIPTNQINRI